MDSDCFVTEDARNANAGAENILETAENAAIEIDAQGDTVEDPIIINESTSSSDDDSKDAADKTN